MSDRLKKICLCFGTILLAAVLSVFAKPVCIDGVCYPSEEAARAAGASFSILSQVREDHPSVASVTNSVMPLPAKETVAASASAAAPRLAMGFMKPDAFLRFLRNDSPADTLAAHSLIVIFLLVLLGGLASNLTPCVLPLVPVNLMIIGKGAVRGAAYGLGLALAYGALGLAAAFGGLAFGAIQSNPWFNAGVACVFVLLALAMSDVFFLDFTKFRRSSGNTPRGARLPLPAVFALGAGAAVLAGACVEPILISVLLLTAKWTAAGRLWAVVLPFILGLGMGLPWPFAAAGFAVLPKPGAWMVWVKRAFALVLVGMAAWYAVLAFRGFSLRGASVDRMLSTDSAAGFEISAVPSAWDAAYAAARKTGKPVLVDVWATWCKNCLAMEQTTLRDPAVRAEMAKFAVIRLQAEDPNAFGNLAAFKSLKITGIPAFVIFGEER